MEFFCDWVMLYINFIYEEIKVQMNYIFFFILKKFSRKLYVFFWELWKELLVVYCVILICVEDCNGLLFLYVELFKKEQEIWDE